MAKLLVSYEAIQVETVSKNWKIACDWQNGANENGSLFRRERPTHFGYKIVKAELVNKDEKNAPVRNVNVEISPEQNKIILTGELIKSGGLLTANEPAPRWLADVKVVMERRSAPQIRNLGDIALTINPNSTIKLPIQPPEPGWQVLKTNVNLELWDGTRKIWEGIQDCQNARVTLQNQACYLTTTMQKDAVVVRIDCPSANLLPKSVQLQPALPVNPPTPVGPVIRPVRFERNPFSQFVPKN
jgi:hypothetical protein